MRNSVGAFQSVLVLGGNSDIARATVDRLVAEGTRAVTLAVRNVDQAKPITASLRAKGVATETVQFDARATDSHEALISGLFRQHGDFDLVIVAFGSLGPGEPESASLAALLEVAETNYLGAVSTMLAVVPHLKQQGHGTIVLLSSVAGERVRKTNYVYGSSKAGIDAFAQGLGDALHGSGVDVMIVRPGFVETKMTAGLKPAPLSTTPDRVADAIVSGLRRRRRSHTVWVPASLRVVMVVLRVLPRSLFRRLNF